MASLGDEMNNALNNMLTGVTQPIDNATGGETNLTEQVNDLIPQTDNVNTQEEQNDLLEQAKQNYFSDVFEKNVTENITQPYEQLYSSFGITSNFKPLEKEKKINTSFLGITDSFKKKENKGWLEYAYDKASEETEDFGEALKRFDTAKQMYEYGIIPNDTLEKRKELNEKREKIKDDTEVQWALDVQKEVNEHGETLAKLTDEYNLLKNKENKTLEDEARLQELEKQISEEQSSYLLSLYKYEAGVDKSKEIDKLIEQEGAQTVFQKYIYPKIQQTKDLGTLVEGRQKKGEEYLKPLIELEEQNSQIKFEQEHKGVRDAVNVYSTAMAARGYILDTQEQKVFEKGWENILNPVEENIPVDDDKKKLAYNVARGELMNIYFKTLDDIVGENASSEDHREAVNLLMTDEFRAFSNKFLQGVVDNADEFIGDDGKINYTKLADYMEGRVKGTMNISNALAKFIKKVDEINAEKKIKESKPNKINYLTVLINPISTYKVGTYEAKKFFKRLKFDVVPKVIYGGSDVEKNIKYYKDIGQKKVKVYLGNNKYKEINVDDLIYYLPSPLEHQYKGNIQRIADDIRRKDEKYAQNTWNNIRDFLDNNVLGSFLENPISATLNLFGILATTGGAAITKIPKVSKVVKGLDEAIGLIENKYLRTALGTTLKSAVNLVDDLPLSVMIDGNIKVDPSVGWYVGPNMLGGLVQGAKLLKDPLKFKRAVYASIDSIVDKGIKNLSEDALKVIQGKLVDDGLGFIKLDDLKQIWEESRGVDKVFKNEVTKKLDEYITDFKLKSDREKIAFINEQSVKENIKRGDLTEEDIRSMLKAKEDKYGEYVENMRLKGMKDEDILVNLLNLENKTIKNLEDRLRVNVFTRAIKMTKLKLPKQIEKTFNEFDEAINKLYESGNITKETADKLKVTLKDLKSKAYTIQVLGLSDDGAKYIEGLNKSFEKFRDTLSDYGVEVGFHGFEYKPLKTIDDIVNVDKIGDVDVKIYDDVSDIGETLDKLSTEIKKHIGEDNFKKYGDVFDIVDNVIKGKIKLTDLPENLRKGIVNMMDVLATTKKESKGVINSLYVVLSNLVKSEVGKELTGGIKNLVHKMSEVFYYGLKDSIRLNLKTELASKLSADIKAIGGIEKVDENLVKKYLPWVTKKEANKYISLFKSGKHDEIIIKMMENSIIDNGLFSFGDIKLMENIDYNFYKIKNVSDSLYDRLSKITNIYLNGMKTIENMANGDIVSITYTKFNEFKNLLGYAFYRKFIGVSKKNFDFLKDLGNVKFYIKNLDNESKTIYMGIDGYKMANTLPNVNKVIDFISDENISVEEISKILPVNFVKHPEVAKTLTFALDKKGIEKLNKALQLAEIRHNKGLKMLKDLYDEEKGILLLEKEIDGKKITLQEALSLIDPNITNMNFKYLDKAIHFSTHDILKYISKGDEEVWNKFLDSYLGSVFKDADAIQKGMQDDFLNKFNDIMDNAIGQKSGDAYKQFLKDVKNVLDDIAKDIQSGENLVDDVMSRLYTDVINQIYWFTERASVLSKDGKTYDEIYKSLVHGTSKKILSDNLSKVSERGYSVFMEKYKKLLDNLDEVIKKENISDDVERITEGLGKRASTPFVDNVMFNINMAHTHFDILKAIGDLQGIEGFKIGRDNLISILGKFTRQRQKTVVNYIYEMLGGGKVFDDLGIFVNHQGYEDTISALQYFKGLLNDHYKEISEVIGKEKLDTVLAEIINLEEKGITDGYSKFLKKEIDDKWASILENPSVDKVVTDTMVAEDAMKEFIDGLNKQRNYMLDANAITIKAVNTVFDDPNFKSSLQNIINVFSDMQSIITKAEDGGVSLSSMIKEGWFDYLWKGEKGELKPFKKIEKGLEGIRITKNDLGKTAFEQVKVYDLMFNDIELQYIDKSFGLLKGIVNELANLQTITKYDSELTDILSNSARWKGFRVPIDTIETLSKILEKEGRNIEKFPHIESYKVIGTIIKRLENYVIKGDIDVKRIANDIVSWYDAKYVSKTHIFPNAVKTIDGFEYKDLIDAYVEIFRVVRKKFARDMFTLDEFRYQINRAFDSFHNYRLNYKETQDLASLQALGGNWIGASVKDLKKLKDRAQYLYNDKMFYAYLFNSLSDSIHAGYKNNAGLKKILSFLGFLFKKTEGASASFMYGSMYSGPMGLSAASQQVIQNYIHNRAMRTAFDIFDIDVSEMQGVMDLFNRIKTFSVTKATRPEFEESLAMEGVEKGFNYIMGKLRKGTRTFLKNVSALTYADSLYEQSASELGLLSALIEHGFTSEGVETLFKNVNEVSREFIEKGYDKYMPIEMMIKLNETNLVEFLEKKMGQLGINDYGKLQEVIADMKKMRDKVGPLYTVMRNAEMKAMTFFQLSKSASLHANQLLGKDGGWIFFRFVNWASKKAGEYANMFYRPLMNGDWKGVLDAAREVVAEGVYTAKLYGYFDRIVNGNTNHHERLEPYKMAMSMWLPAVVLNMTSLNLIDSIVEATGADNQFDVSGIKAGFTKRLFNGLGEWMGGMGGRGGLPIMFWLGQYYKIQNGLSLIEDEGIEGETHKVYANNFVNTMKWMADNVLLGRMGRHLMTRSNGIIFDSVNSPISSIISFAINEDISDKQNIVHDIYNAYFDIIKQMDKEDNGGKSIIASIIPYQVDLRPALLAIDDYFNKEGLYGYFWGFNSRSIANKLDGLERMVDDKSMENFIKDNEWLAADFEIEKKLKGDRLERTTKVWSMITAMLNPSMGNTRQKGLRRIGAGIDEEAFKQYQEDYKKISSIIEKRIYDYVGDDYKKMKEFKIGTIYFDDEVKDRTEQIINKWGNAILYKATLDAMRKQYKKILAERMKSKYGNTKSQAYYNDYYKELKAWELHTLSANYESLLSLNQEIGVALSQLHIKNDEGYPLKQQLSKNYNLGKYWYGKLYEGIAERQGLFNSGIHTIYGYIMDKVMGGVTKKIKTLKDEEKIKNYMDKTSNLINQVVDQIDKFYGPTIAQNVKTGIAAHLVDYIEDIVKFMPETAKKLKDSFDRWLDIVHVQHDTKLEDVTEDLTEDLQKETSGGGTVRKSKVSIPSRPSARLPRVNMRQVQDKLIKGGDMIDGRRTATGRLPRLYGPDYVLRGSGIRGIRLPNVKAKKPKIKLDFIKLLKPEETKTIDLQVAREKKTKIVTRYRPKKVKTVIKFSKTIRK